MLVVAALSDFAVLRVLSGAQYLLALDTDRVQALARLSIAAHAPRVRLGIVLTLLTVFDALALAVALFAITRRGDPDLAVLALSCRIGEGLLNAIGLVAMLSLLWLAMATAAEAPDAAAANALGAALLLKVRGWSWSIGGTAFAVGSTLYSWLFLRAPSVPVPLAWLGVLASILLVVLLPAQLVGFVKRPVTDFMWIPTGAFEVALGLWLLLKGVAMPASRRT